MKKIKIKEVLIGIVTTIFSWIYFIVFLYSANVKEVNIAETGSSFAVFIGCAFLSFAIGCVLYKNICSASVFGIILAVLLTNFSLILSVVQKIFPQIRYWHLLYLDAILAILSGVVAKRFANLMLLVIQIICIVYAGLAVMNLFMAAPTIIRKINANIDINSAQGEKENQATQGNSTNIYYILCDEYGSFDQLMQEYGYGNSEFRNYLIQNEFNISENSYNYVTSTHIALSNIMSLDYVADTKSTAKEMENYCQNGILHSILNEYGYLSRGIGETAWLGIDGTLEMENGAKTAEGDSFKAVVLKNTFLSISIQNNNSEEAQKIIDTLDDFVGMPIKPNASEFVMIYVKAPHHPYYFNSDGSMNVPSKYSNADGTNAESYLGEIEWLNRYLETGISRIIENDPESIIVLCSDHGNRFGIKNIELSKKILNAIYYKGESRNELKDLSGINTLKYILNHEVGTNLEYTANPE